MHHGTGFLGAGFPGSGFPGSGFLGQLWTCPVISGHAGADAEPYDATRAGMLRRNAARSGDQGTGPPREGRHIGHGRAFTRGVPMTAAAQEPALIRIDALRSADSPRLKGISEDHARMLAESATG